MSLVFGPKSNAIAVLVLIVIIGSLFLAGALAYAYYRTTFVTETRVPLEQPIPFSHQHHVAMMGIDCRYCHTSVEVAANAGLPGTHTCMTCHSQIWSSSPLLQVVRESFKNSRPIQWNRVNRLPDFVYFNHAIHVAKGIGCSSCHGRVDQMPITWKHMDFQMRQCLDCHESPEKFIRPRDQVFNMKWQAPEDQERLGAELVREYHIPKERMMDCTLCHR